MIVGCVKSLACEAQFEPGNCQEGFHGVADKAQGDGSEVARIVGSGMRSAAQL